MIHNNEYCPKYKDKVLPNEEGNCSLCNANLIDTTLIDLIEHDMSTDDEDREEQSEYLKAEYNSCSVEQKAAINKIFIALCGWSLEKIMVREQALKSKK